MPIRLRPSGLAVAMALTVLRPSTTFGQAPHPPSEESADLSARALAFAKSGEFEKARELYLRVWQGYPDTTVLFNLGLAELRSGHPVEALEHFDLYVTKPDAEPAKVDVIRTNLRPRAYATSGHIVVTDDPALAHATMLLDGHDVSGRLFHVLPGDHDIVARAPSGLVSRANVRAIAGEEVKATLQATFVGQPSGGAPPPAREPAATAISPPSHAPAPTSPTPATQTSAPAAAPATPATTTPPISERGPSGSPRPTFAIVATGVGALVVAGGGIAAFLAAGSADDQGRTQCAIVWSSNCDGQRSTVRTLDTLALGAWIGAGALAATSIILWVAHPGHDEGKSVSLRIGPGRLGLEGTF